MEQKLKLAIFAKIDLLTTDLTIARDLLNEGSENGAIGSLLSRVNTVSELLCMLTILRDYK